MTTDPQPKHPTAFLLCGALAREESRGAHFRRDFPQTDNARWLQYTVQRATDSEVALRLEPIPMPYMQPPVE